MSEHTPGPWREYDNTDLGDRYLCDANGLAVAMVIEATFPRIEGRTEANATLIAAAPELLEVLQDWYRIAMGTGGEPVIKNRIEAAIAKATGKAEVTP